MYTICSVSVLFERAIVKGFLKAKYVKSQFSKHKMVLTTDLCKPDFDESLKTMN